MCRFRRQPAGHAAHADGSGGLIAHVAHVTEPEYAHHQPVRAERVPHAAAAVQQPPDDERARFLPGRPARGFPTVERVLRLHKPAAEPRNADSQLDDAPVALAGRLRDRHLQNEYKLTI